MSSRTRPSIIGGVGSLITGAWGFYANFTTASQLPADASWIAKMIADPPVYLPWLAFAGFVVLLGWAIWPRDELRSESEATNITTSGQNSPAFGTVHGSVTINNGLASDPTMPQRLSAPYDMKALNDGLERAFTELSQKPSRPKYKTWDYIEPKRDVGLAEALAYAEFREWGRSFIDAASAAQNEANENLVRFRQLAFDGEISVWGKASEGGVYEPIPSSHWQEYDVEWFDLLRGTPRTENRFGQRYSAFFDLMVSKTDFEREWPHEPK